LNKRPKRLRNRILLVLGALGLTPFLILVILYLFSPGVCVLKKQNPDTTSFMELRKAEALKMGRKLPLRHEWVLLSRIPHLLQQAVVSAEDDRFFEHHGFDWQEIRKALSKKKEQKKLRGASTISQQLVKNLYLSPERSLLRKVREFIITFKLERCLSKKRILECYLNLIELGPGIFGVQAASRSFFSKPVSDLNREEILRLVSVIPQPLRVSPHSNGKYLRWRIRWIDDRLRRRGL
jgi:monofunctional biosynthetic peptidoglycan transglycosylase